MSQHGRVHERFMVDKFIPGAGLDLPIQHQANPEGVGFDYLCLLETRCPGLQNTLDTMYLHQVLRQFIDEPFLSIEIIGSIHFQLTASLCLLTFVSLAGRRFLIYLNGFTAVRIDHVSAVASLQTCIQPVCGYMILLRTPRLPAVSW
jgi:hypothetical protein